MILDGPSFVELSPSTMNYTINETDGIGPIFCSADCKPNCTFSWSGPNLPYWTSSLLYLQFVNRSHAGDYHCNASNSIGTAMSSTVRVIVYCKC